MWLPVKITFFLLRRSQAKRSPHGTYSITRNIFSSSVQHPTIDTTFLCEPNIFICSISNVNSSFCVSDGSSKDNWIKWFCLLPVVRWQHLVVNLVLDFSFAWHIFIPFYCTHSHLICTKGQVHFTLVIAFQFNTRYHPIFFNNSLRRDYWNSQGACGVPWTPTLFTLSQALTVV